MERDRQVSRAKDVLRRLLGRYDKRRHRIHKQAAEDNVDRLRALDGICGNCPHLDLRFGHRDGKDIVGLKCTKGHMPARLYWKTDYGETPVCKDQDKIV